MDIEEMFKIQLDYQKKIFKSFDKLSEDRKRNLTKEFLLHAVTEMDELLSNVGEWKTHKIGIIPPRKSGINEELVDIFKFIVNIATVWGITPGEFVEKFREKSIVNEQKFLWEHRLKELKDKEVAIFDIDGVLNDYPRKAMNFLNEKTNLGLCLDKYMNIPMIIEYKKCIALKEEFREKRLDTVEYSNEAREITKMLKNLGISIVLLTSRPFEHKKTFNDLVISLVKNKISFDLLITDPEKAMRIIKDFRNPRFFVDDEPKFVTEVSKTGIRCYLLNAPYNDEFSARDGITRVFSLREILDREELP